MPSIIYCKTNSTVFVYNTECWDLLLKIDCEDVKFITKKYDPLDRPVSDCNGTFVFSYKKNNKYGLISAEINPDIRVQNQFKALNEKLLEANYDGINYHNGIFYLRNDDKKGLYLIECKDFIIEPKYDGIESFGCDYYAFYNGEYCDISVISSPLKPLAEKCKIVESFRDSLIFKRDDGYGIFNCNRYHHYSFSNSVSKNYDKVNPLDNDFFEVERKGKKGIDLCGSVIIPLEFDEISFHFYEKKFLQKANKGIKLAKRNNSRYSKVELINNNTFEEIKFLEDIMVLKDEINCFIYDYDNEKLLGVFPADTEISMVFINANQYNQKTLYYIDGIHYLYKDGKLQRAYTKSYDMYVTTFECDYDVEEVKIYDKCNQDQIWKNDGYVGEENIEQTIFSIDEKNPVLVKK